MTSQACLVQPPRIAAWLVNLFAPGEEAESILGDLLEEYSHLASKSGVAFARSWYWRQTVTTIAHLVGTGFSVAPWSTTAAVVGGFLLRRFVSGLPERAIFAVLHRYQVSETHFGAYAFLASYGIAIGHFLIASVFVGCMVALAAKGREMVATMTLALVLCALIGAALVWVATHQSMDVAWMVWSCADPFAIVVGGIIVRESRSVISRHHSSA
jgi:hypothetical protein